MNEVPHFVARESELAEIHESLCRPSARSTVVVHGLGGMGKTQLAIEYATRHRDDYDAVFWFNIKDETAMKQSFVRAARRIAGEHPSVMTVGDTANDEDLHILITKVKGWLDRAKNTNWLLIYDNYDNPKMLDNPSPTAVDIRPFLPDAYHGSVLITTRVSNIGIGRPVRVKQLENDIDSLSILTDASRRDDLAKGNYSLCSGPGDVLMQCRS